MDAKNGLEFVQLDIRGMTCDDCAEHVRKALKDVKGVDSALVPGWESGLADVTLTGETSSDELLQAVRNAGYSARVHTRRETGGQGQADYDLIVIGTGSAGMAAAIRAAESGHRTAIVEAGTIGGTCVNIGCIPSKALVRAAEVYYRAGHHHFAGVHTRAESVDWKEVLRQKNELVDSLRGAKYADVLSSYGESIKLFRQRARLDGRGGVVLADGKRLTGNKILVAAGASPRILPLDGIDKVPVLTSTSLMNLEKLPESLIIIGGRAIALELGQVMARFGVRVTILQRSGSLVPEFEPEISADIERYLSDEGVEIHTGVQPQSIRFDGSEKAVGVTENGTPREFHAQEVLMAVGRRANTEGLGLEEAGVQLDGNGFIVVDEQMRTSHEHIYAAGDVTNNPKFVYVAAASGGLAAANMLVGAGQPLNLSVLPEVVFTDPQMAAVGLTERDAEAAGFNIKTTVMNMNHVPRALAAQDTRGLVKLIQDTDTGKLLGAHIVAPEGGEMIQTLTLAIKFGIGVADLVGTLFPYLTLNEGIRIAAQTFDKDPARLSCCA
ncbi:MAG: mercury(II) reductase [Spirochaetaceae bacterium]|nr:mercury(II) reductase [Spirochaetaceae bacterium]